MLESITDQKIRKPISNIKLLLINYPPASCRELPGYMMQALIQSLAQDSEKI